MSIPNIPIFQYSGFTSTSYVSVFRSASERRSQPGLRIPYNTSGGKTEHKHDYSHKNRI